MFTYTVGPRMMFYSMFFSYHVDEKEKKNHFSAGATVCVGFAVLPMSVLVFPGDSGVLPHPRGVHMR